MSVQRHPVADLGGALSGAQKATASRWGMSYDEYAQRKAAGEKRCSRCKQWKAESEYGQKVQFGDGLDVYCRPCSRLRDAEQRQANPEARRAAYEGWRARNRERYLELARVAARERRDRDPLPHNLRNKAWRDKHPEYRAKDAVSIRQWNERNPDAAPAQKALQNAVKRGRIFRPSICESCSAEKPLHGHHHLGYAHPLDVQWLCRRCHRLAHTRGGVITHD